MNENKNDKMKRTIVEVKQYPMDTVEEIDGKFVIRAEGRTIGNFKNFFITTLENVEKITIDTTIDKYFILKFDPIKDDDLKGKKRYQDILENGIYINNIKYIKSVKSPSMQRTQKTLFIREDIAQKVFEYVSLGRKPKLTVVSKFESAVGIILSSVLMIDYLPKIVVIPDFENIVTEDVEVLVDHQEDSEDLRVMEEQIAYEQEWKKIKPSQEFLTSIEHKKSDSNHKSKSRWEEENRRVKMDELLKPVGHGTYDGKLFGVYHIDQTEEQPFIRLTPSTVGKKLITKRNHPNQLTQFDGQSLGSFEFFERVKEELGLKYVPNAVQSRLPYFKSLTIRFDFKSWCRENGVSQIKDVFGDWHDVVDIDIIATKSCWKVFHAYEEERKHKNKCLFDSMQDYYDQLEKYGFNQFGIANYAKSKNEMKEYTPLTYQFFHGMNINLEQIKELSKPFEEVLKKVQIGKDIAHVKAFLEMIGNMDNVEGGNDTLEDELNIEEFREKAMKLISMDERLLFDKKVRLFLKKQVSNKLADLLEGRVPVRGGYRYVTNDPIAFMEWAAGKEEVKGFIKGKYNMYMRWTTGTYVLLRNPLTSHKEVITCSFFATNNKWVQHLDNIIICGINDLALPALSGADVDGDILFHTKEPIILSSVIKSLPLINEGDKQTVDPVPYDNQSIMDYELRNTYPLTGIVTNMNTRFQDMALAYLGDVSKAELPTSIGKILQMDILDSVKTGKKVDIPYAFEKIGGKEKPYFMRHIYGGWLGQYSTDLRSPFNRYVVYIEDLKERVEALELKDIDPLYFESVSNPKWILQDWDNQASRKHILEVIDKIKPLYTEYNKEKQSINLEMKKFRELPRHKKDDSVRKGISKRYSELAEKYRLLCEAIEPNPSILATSAVEVAYINETYSFAWDVAFDGMCENAITNQLPVRTMVAKINNPCKSDYTVKYATVKDGQVEFDTIEKDGNTYRFNENSAAYGEKAPTMTLRDCEIKDGRYQVIEIMGKHFVSWTVEKKLQHLKQSVPHKDKSESTACEILNKKIRILTLTRKAIDVIPMVLGNTYVLKADSQKGYVNVFDGEEHLCSFPPDKINENGYSLLDFDGMKVTFTASVEPKKQDAKSFTAYVNLTF